jgi:hypothetical protein
MTSILRALACACAVLLAAPMAALADGVGPDRILQAAAFSKQIELALAERGARLAIVFRAGRARDDLPEGIRYTHGGFFVYQPLQSVDGSESFDGYAVYHLYAGDPSGESDPRSSFLAQDFPIDFTLPMHEREAGIIIPSPALQRRILAVMASEDYQALHHENYSLLSNPHDAEFQNSNEFMLDVIAAALWETTDREQLKVNLAAHFQPARVRLNMFERMFGPIVDRRVEFGDHNGRVYTTTFRSMADFLESNGYALDVFELRYDPDQVIEPLEY